VEAALRSVLTQYDKDGSLQDKHIALGAIIHEMTWDEIEYARCSMALHFTIIARLLSFESILHCQTLSECFGVGVTQDAMKSIYEDFFMRPSQIWQDICPSKLAQKDDSDSATGSSSPGLASSSSSGAEYASQSVGTVDDGCKLASFKVPELDIDLELCERWMTPRTPAERLRDNQQIPPLHKFVEAITHPDMTGADRPLHELVEDIKRRMRVTVKHGLATGLGIVRMVVAEQILSQLVGFEANEYARGQL